MNFDLSQLLQGPVRNLVLNQVTKQLGISNEAGGSLLTKGLSMVLGGMTKQASSAESAKGLFDLIKNSNFQGNPLDMLTGKGEGNGSQLLEMGKNILPSLFGDKTDAVISHLSHSTNTTPVAAKGLLGMLLPVVFSFFKGKILSGLGLGAFTKLLGDQTKALSSHLDSNALSALGFAGGSIDNVLSGLSKVSGAFGSAATATAAAKPAKSGLGKWILPAAVLLAALLGLKNCYSNKADTAVPAQPVAPQAEVATPEVNVSEGLGDLAWAKSDKDFTVSGTVQNDGVKAGILDAFKGLAGNLPLVDKLAVDANAPKFGFDNFAGLAGLMKEFPNVDGSFADTAFNLVGKVAGDDAKAALADKAKALLGNAFNINTDGVSVEAPVANIVDGLGNFAWAKSDKDFTLSGTVQNDGVKAGILDAFKGLAGNLPLVDKLAVDANAPKFGFDNFAGLAGLMKEFPNVDGSFADTAFNLVGKVAGDDAKAALADKAKALLGNAFNINTDGVSVESPVANIVDGLGNFAWAKSDKDFTVSGTVQNDGVKAGILDAFKGLAGDLPLVDKLAVDANAPQFNFGNFAGLANLAKSFPSVDGSFADKAFNLVGQVANGDAKTALVDQAKALLGDVFTVNADKVTIAEQATAEQAATPAAETAQAEPEAEVIADMSADKLDLAIVFNSGSAEISNRYYNRLNAFAKFLIENNRGGEIAGYTDNTGDANANQQLSEKRANAVRNYLVQQGVPAERLTAVGYGEQDPIADNNTAEGRNKNRRIEFNVR